MDVTSLLNVNSSTAVDQQNEMETVGVEQKAAIVVSKAPGRARTPWDAGGYSLPINSVSSRSTPQAGDAHYHDDSHSSAPTSPGHKYNDSHSSLSSFTSSSRSKSHSRFSSLSTLGSFHLSSNLGEAFFTNSSQKPHPLDFGHTAQMDENQTSLPCPRPGGSISPTESLDALALAAETRLGGRQEQQQHGVSVPQLKDSASNLRVSEMDFAQRPCSPSDAILIKRATTLPSLQLDTREQESKGMNESQLNRHYLSAPLESHHQSLVHARSHKRALSAPNFQGFKMSSHPFRAEPSPPTSQHPDRDSPTIMPAYPTPVTPPTMASSPAPAAIVCMYMPDCATGSQLRKAISHILGRNKMCTRQIPKEVWVHYCRKHYQRSRYRNPKEYAKLQCDLVQEQIRRVHDWSLANAAADRPGIVQDWTLTVRKREQKRLDDKRLDKLTGDAKKRTASAAFDDDSENDDEEVNPLGLANSSKPVTAVPDWVLELCGTGYSTQSILEIFNRLHNQILDDDLACFPDIELLPNIMMEQGATKSPKGTVKKVTTMGHKRAKSASVTLRPNAYAEPRRMSQPSVTNEELPMFVPVGVQERGYQNGTARVNSSGSAFTSHASRPAQQSFDTGRRVQPLSRPSFPSIDENPGSEDNGYSYSPGGPYERAHLVAPIPQRNGGRSMAANIEMANGQATRPVHQRSYSDMSGSFNSQHTNSSAPTGMSSMYTPEANYYDHSSAARPRTESYFDFQQSSHRAQQPQRNQQPAYVGHHGRHQSMTMAPSNSMYSTPPSSGFQYPQHQQLYSPSGLSNRIHEDRSAQDSYASRR